MITSSLNFTTIFLPISLVLVIIGCVLILKYIRSQEASQQKVLQGFLSKLKDPDSIVTKYECNSYLELSVKYEENASFCIVCPYDDFTLPSLKISTYHRPDYIDINVKINREFTDEFRREYEKFSRSKD